MTKYLYGANVKAVQSFIFQTGRLKEIIGASELVEQICSSLFKKQVGTSYNLDNCIISAAGIIKYVFDDKTQCQNLVKFFPKVVMEAAPGIVFNQAVVEMAKEQPSHEELKELEQRLKTQRNKAAPPLETGLRVITRSPRTGLPAIIVDVGERLDKSTNLKKTAKYDGVGSLTNKLIGDPKNFRFPEDIKEIAGKDNNIAIIHADGNNLGKAIRDLNENNTTLDSMDSIERNRIFSTAINDATLAAAKMAVQQTFKDLIEHSARKSDGKAVVLPMRPVLLGGDDFTIICRAEYALKLTTDFLAEFEKESATSFKKHKLNLPPLTACAGIAYIKTNYPFHYGAKLAEDLCAYSKQEAKKHSANQVPACLTFHRVQSSFVGDYSDIMEQELFAAATNLSLSGGPYYISLSGENQVSDLMKQVDCLKNKNTPASKLREWFSTCHVDGNLAKKDLESIIRILETQHGQEIIEGLSLDKLFEKLSEKIKKSPEEKIQTTLYDAITIHSLTNKN